MSKIPVYIASPYAGDVEGNIAFAVRCCRYAIQQGEIPIAPHLLYSQILDDNNLEERSIGLSFGHQLLGVCKEIWVCGTQISHGMEGEIKVAKERNLPIRYVSEQQIASASCPDSMGPVAFKLCSHQFTTPERMVQIANNAIDSFGELLNGRSLYDALAGSLKMDDPEILAAGFTTLKEFMGGASDGKSGNQKEKE